MISAFVAVLALVVAVAAAKYLRAFMQIWPQAKQVIHRAKNEGASSRVASLPVERVFEDARRGNVAAQYRLGIMYSTGDGLRKSEQKAVEWLRKAADAGLEDAQYGLAFHYEHGRGTERNVALATDWYRRAAESGHAAASCNLGLLYAHDETFDLTWPHAAYWLTRAAAQKVPEAAEGLRWLARQHARIDSGNGVLRDYRKLAANGDTNAQLLMGWIAESGITGEQSSDVAQDWYERAKSGGNIYAHVLIETFRNRFKRVKGSNAKK